MKRYLDQSNSVVTAIEVSDAESLENFITIWFQPGSEDGLWDKIGDQLWKNPLDKFRHDPPIFHADDYDSKWSVTRHHYHISYDHEPNVQDIFKIIELLNSVKECVSPTLKQLIGERTNG